MRLFVAIACLALLGWLAPTTFGQVYTHPCPQPVPYTVTWIPAYSQPAYSQPVSGAFHAGGDDLGVAYRGRNPSGASGDSQ